MSEILLKNITLLSVKHILFEIYSFYSFCVNVMQSFMGPKIAYSCDQLVAGKVLSHVFLIFFQSGLSHLVLHIQRSLMMSLRSVWLSMLCEVAICSLYLWETIL